MSFIKLLLDHTAPYESPESFWKWSAYCTVAAVMRDSCYIRQGDSDLYPNVYVLLLADSAVHRKGNPVRFCEKLTSKISNTKIISGRTSIQAILDELARGETHPKTGKTIKGGSALFSAAELSAGIVNDPEAIKILTDIYDFKEEYTSRLRGTGTFHIKNICFTMMAASNESLLIDLYDEKARTGGLLGRTFLVKPNEFRPGNSLFDFPDTTASMKRILDSLLEISKLSGEMIISDAAKLEYNNWYKPFRASQERVKDKTGILGRIHTSILKLAMVLCADHTLGLSIQKCHVEEAISEGMGLLPNYTQFVMSGGKSPISNLATIVLQQLFDADNHSLSRAYLLRTNWNEFTMEDFDKFIATMEQALMIGAAMFDDGIGYKLTKKCIEILFKDQIQ